jgi:hypothetical protein
MIDRAGNALRRCKIRIAERQAQLLLRGDVEVDFAFNQCAGRDAARGWNAARDG